MGVKIQFKSANLVRQIRRAQHRCRHMGPAFRQIGDEAIRSVRRTFRAKGRPEKWKRRKPLRYGRRTWPILVKTGEMRDSIQAKLFHRGVEVGSDLPRAGFHQYGTKNMPARPFLVVQNEDEETFATIIERYILGGLA